MLQGALGFFLCGINAPALDCVSETIFLVKAFSN
jgi:hypothetical protein